MSAPRRTFLAATAAGLAAALALTACSDDPAGGGSGSADGEPTPVVFGYIADFNGANLLAVAEDQGLWEEHGLAVETKVFTNGPLQIQALGAGDLDFGYIGPGAIWLPASGQAKIVAMNTLGGSDRVIAQPGLDSIEDLRGKKVGVPEGTSGDMILTLALEEAGMTKDDIEVTPMDPATIVSAFASGSIDAAGFWYPATATIKESVPDLVELASNEDFPQTRFPTAFVSSNELVQDDPETLAKVLAALRDAVEFREQNPEETVALTAQMLDIPVEQVEADAEMAQQLTLDEIDTATRDGEVAGWLDGIQDFFVSAGKLEQKADAEEFYTGDAWLDAR